MSEQSEVAGRRDQLARKVAAPIEDGHERFDVRKFADNFEAMAEALGGPRQLRALVLRRALTQGFEPGGNQRWTSGTVGDFVSFLNGYAFKSEWFVERGVRLLRNANVSHGTLDWTDVAHLSKERSEEFKRFLLAPGDLVLTLDRPIISTGVKVARVGMTDLPCLLLQRVAKVSGGADLVDPSYLFAWLKSPLFTETIDPGRSNGVPHISTKEVQQIPFRLPPLDEQKRIVARVDRLMALIDDLEAKQIRKREINARFTKASLEAITTAEAPDQFDAAWKRVVENWDTVVDRAEKVAELRSAVLGLALSGHLAAPEEGVTASNEMRGRKPEVQRVPPAECPYTIPPHWSWHRLRDVLASLTDGDHQAPPQVAVGVPFLTIGNVSKGVLDFSGARAVPRSYFEALDARRVPKMGDILYTVVGATYGRPVPVDEPREFCVQRHIAILRPDGTIDRDFLYLYLRSSIAYDQATNATTGTAQPTVPLKPLREFKVPLPPLAEQKRIVAKVQRLMKLCDDLEAKLRRAEDRASKLVEAVVQEMVA